MWELISRSPRVTEMIGEELGRLLAGGDVVSLSGSLGVGKTVFIHGVARGLDVDDPVTSPSFMIVQEYEGRCPVFHADFYRLRSYQELEGIGWDDYLRRHGVILIEWGNLFPEALPSEFLQIDINQSEPIETARLIRFEPRGGHYEAIVKELADRCGYLA